MNNSFWAKKEYREGISYWLPLFQHLDDTRLVSGLLWEHWLSQGQKDIITKGFSKQTGVLDAEEIDMLGKRVIMFLGAVHDIGKATPAFQTKKGYKNPEDLDSLLLEKLERDGFYGISTQVFSDPGATPHSVAGQVLLSGYSQRFQDNEDIGSIVGGHHGKPIDSRGRVVFPACAGVIPRSRCRTGRPSGVPRMRGGDPVIGSGGDQHITCSPHARG